MIVAFTIDLSVSQMEVKVCEQNSMQLTLKKLNDVPGKNRWLANITSLDFPLPDHFDFKINVITHGSDYNLVKWERNFTRETFGRESTLANGLETLLENLQDAAYFSEPVYRDAITIDATVPDVGRLSYDFAFVIEFENQTGFPIVYHLAIGRDKNKNYEIVICDNQVCKHSENCIDWNVVLK